jgi:hypothetical protein
MTTSLESTFGKRHKGLSIRNFIKEKGPASNIEHTPTTNKMQYTPLTSKSIGNLPSMYLNDNHDGYNYNNEEDEMELIQELEVVPQRHEAKFVPSESNPYQNARHDRFAPLTLNWPLDTSTARQLLLPRKHRQVTEAHCKIATVTLISKGNKSLPKSLENCRLKVGAQFEDLLGRKISNVN